MNNSNDMIPISIVIIIAAIICVFVILKYCLRFRNALTVLVISMGFLLFVEYASAQNDAAVSIFADYGQKTILCIMIGYVLWKKMFLEDRNFIKLTGFFLIFVAVDICGIALTYADYDVLAIMRYSLYDSCKYFIIIYFLMSARLTQKEVGQFLKIFSVVIAVCTVLAACQFMGMESFYDGFRGRFDIVIRNGMYRAIGIFPHGIELGNYSAVMFALYYNLNKQVYHSKWFLLVCGMLALNTLFSGTRTAMLIIVVIFALANLDSVKNFVNMGIILVAAVLVLSTIIDFQSILARTKHDLNVLLPRQYYLEEGMEVWKESPLVGIGYQTYGTASYRQLTDDYIFDKYDIHEFDYAQLATTDSFIAQIIPEYGILGVLTLLFFFGFIWKQYRVSPQNKENKAYLMVIAAVMIVSYNSSSAFFSPHVGAVFWLVCGLLIGNSANNKKEGNKSLGGGEKDNVTV